MFKNPIAPKARIASKTFAAPTKDNVTISGGIAAGDYYGTGYRNPVGTVRESGKQPQTFPAKSFTEYLPKSLA